MKFGRPDYDERLQPTGTLQPYDSVPAQLIPADEPVFLIRAADKLGIAMLRAYAAQLEHVNADDDGPMVAPALIASVRAQIRQMECYRKSLKKYPDLP